MTLTIGPRGAGRLHEAKQEEQRMSASGGTWRRTCTVLLAALFGFFDENPSASRLLFRDPRLTRVERRLSG